jgi:hypothetical protein
MRRFTLSLMLAGAAALSGAPLAAQMTSEPHQVDPNQPQNDGSAAASATVPPGAVAPGVDPGTANANANVQGNIAATATANANNSAQYDSDLANYDAAMRAHGRADAHYARQKQAYADAMAAWRVQTAACLKGHQVACNAPAPDPANFY